jgi:uncharacterized protein with LGFP repeats
VRRVASALTVLAATAGMLAVPVLARSVAQAHAVAPHLASVVVHPRPATQGVLGVTTQPRTHRFDLVGATWRWSTLPAGAPSVQVRVRADGRWSGWRSLEPSDGGADGGTPDARRARAVTGGMAVAEPVYVGAADGLQARVVGTGRVPDDLRVLLVDGGRSGADAHPQPVRVWGGDIANAEQDQPTIYSRADWGADESLRKGACPNGPSYSPTIKMGFLHHTDGTNGYSRSQVPSIIRSIYAYHVRANGWCDVGYNYLVDRFGRIWEGRAGGITKPVLGAHTGGFNYDSFGVSLIGSYDKVQPSAEMLSATEQLFAWRLGGYYVDPTRSTTLVAGSFSGSRYPTGSTVRFKTISGHRDADETACPGRYAYADLTDIRPATRALMGAGFVAPALSSTSAQMANGSFTVTAGAITAQTWTLTVTDPTGVAVRTLTGTASRSVDVTAVWDLTDGAGAPVPPGAYTLTLTATNDAGATAVPWASAVTVTPPVTLSADAQTTLDAPAVVKGHGIPGHTVNVTVAGPDGSQTVGSFLVSGKGNWSSSGVPVTADRDLEWTVTDPAVPSYSKTKTTRVGPTVTAPAEDPAFVSTGDALTISGTALPGPDATVAVVTAPAGGGAETTGPAFAVADDGTWAVSFVPRAATSYRVVDGRGLSTPSRLVYPVDPASATAPAAGYAGRKVSVRGNAGGAPVAVTLSARQPGGSWAAVRSVTPKADGRYRIALPLADTPGEQTRWRIRTGFGPRVTGSVAIEPVFAPTVTGPRRSAWHARHTLTGTAVPGDVVTVWTAPAGTPGDSTRWVRRGTTTAAADDTWSFRLRFSKDTAWRVTSASGASAVGTTVVVPTISAPAHVVSRALAVIGGRAIPGQTVTLYRRVEGSASWVPSATKTVAADGTWSVRRHPRRSAAYRAESHGQTSRTVTVAVD